MSKITRGGGTNGSERRLAAFAERTFLDLWSYPNTFIDKKQHGAGTGKEFCDLFVVCGDDLIIFSDKYVQWPIARSIDVAWARWYRKAIASSVNQINGAVGWLNKHPDRIFIDPHCKTRIPIEMPDVRKRRVHGVVVSNGSNVACRQHYRDLSGTFVVNPHIKGGDHIDPSHEYYGPFSIGDVNPDAAFVHVFDTEALRILFQELDTISDFTKYMNERSDFIRSGKLYFAAGEEDLLAHYLKYTDKSGEHKFLLRDDRPLRKKEVLAVEGGSYNHLRRMTQYKLKKQADLVSYNWDRLIGRFTHHIIEGTNVRLYDDQPLGTFAEPALRIMAQETRVSRRSLGQQLIDSFDTAVAAKQPRFNRTILPHRKAGRRSDGKRVAYIFIIMSFMPEKFSGNDKYELYRRLRANFLEALCYSVGYDYREATHAVAIGFDAPKAISGRSESSEDLVGIEFGPWTPEMEQHTLAERERLGIKSPRSLPTSFASVKEWSDNSSPIPSGLSRQARRAIERASRKRDRH
ncbi:MULTISPECIES: hypothetical protein [unclassified Methylobacterium]|uniref:hypothetical protein n=1 Tax=unclassified Methylobacterium TaxID=2615210 RepID=UPI00226AB988|nr:MULTISPECIES: hypothetical protein [unclassified Methylobacterium]